ncbi:hypothetical protein [Bacteroides thetaiotaomicron]|uniref:hypothetical protein n=1 Tax=Bacteroides thetaiotaomicron TaxID=818 RepID=UPI0039C2DA84
MEKSLDTLYCSECGGTNVQIMAWVDANTNKYCSDVNTPAEVEDTWCEDCEDHTGLETIQELWDSFPKSQSIMMMKLNKSFCASLPEPTASMFGIGLTNGALMVWR